jgi:ABC-type transporter Mla subunit MlaD
MDVRHAELKAGIVVLAAGAALIGFLLVASGGTFLGNFRHVHMRVDPGDLAPKEGDSVRINGVVVGTITKVSLRFHRVDVATMSEEERLALAHASDVEPGARSIRLTYVHCVARLPRDQVLPMGTWGEISAGLTESRQLNLTLGRSETDVLTDGETEKEPIVIRQVATLASVTEQVGALIQSLDGVAGELKGVASGAQLLIEDTRRLIADLRAKVEALDVEGTSEDIREAARTLRRMLESAEAQSVEIAANITEATNDVKEIGATGARIADRLEVDLREMLASLKAAAAEVEALIQRASPRVDALLDEAEGTAANLRQLTADLGLVGPDVRALLASVGRDADDLMQALVDTGQNILDASEDLRAHPWKLLNKPDADEIAYENVRNAMQNYVRAMREMNDTASRLRDALGSGAPLDADARARIQEAVGELESARGRYRGAEQRLMDLLRETAPPAAPGAPRRPGR